MAARLRALWARWWGHRYLSTACLHGRHGYCQAMIGYQGGKRPGKCKFCDARCRCRCHRLGAHRAAQAKTVPESP